MKMLKVTFLLVCIALCVAGTVPAQAADVIVDSTNAMSLLQAETGITISTDAGDIVFTRASQGIQRISVNAPIAGNTADPTLGGSNTWTFTALFRSAIGLPNGDSPGAYGNIHVDMHNASGNFNWIGVNGGLVASDPQDFIRGNVNGGPLIANPETAGNVGGSALAAPADVDGLQLQKTATDLVLRYRTGGSFTTFATAPLASVGSGGDNVAYLGFVFGGPNALALRLSQISTVFGASAEGEGEGEGEGQPEPPPAPTWTSLLPWAALADLFRPVAEAGTVFLGQTTIVPDTSSLYLMCETETSPLYPRYPTTDRALNFNNDVMTALGLPGVLGNNYVAVVLTSTMGNPYVAFWESLLGGAGFSAANLMVAPFYTDGGDYNNNGTSNAAEFTAAGTIAEFLDAQLAPGLPVAGIVGLGLLAGVSVLSGIAVIRRRRK